MDHLRNQKKSPVDDVVGKKESVRSPSTTSSGIIPVTSDNLTLLQEPHNLRASTHETIQYLQQTVGNRAVQRLLDGDNSKSSYSAITPFMIQREGEEDEVAPKAKTPPKAMIDKAKAISVLQDSYKDYVTEIKGGSVKVLEQAAFQVAYDKIYGETQYSWDKYVKPGPGNLEGFAYKNVNYINKDIGSVDVVPHEMLHNNDHADWRSFAGSETNEGTTEYLTIKAVVAKGYTASHSYPDQEGVVQELVKMTSEDLLMKAYFKGETTALKTKMESKCKGSWSEFKVAMQAKKWTKAKGHLAVKPSP
jgi:hypothetical protein